MDLEPVTSSDLQPDFLNLSLLICRLFVGGNFRLAHIIYHQEAFDDRLLTAIDSACPNQIPMMTTDISTSGPFETPQIERPDYILQLIFLPRGTMAEIMNRIAKLLTFYRVFIFSSILLADPQRNWMADVKHISNLNSSSLLLIQNESNGAIESYLLSKNFNAAMEPVDLQGKDTKTENEIFDMALGVKAIGRYFGVTFVDQIDCKLLDSVQNKLSVKTSRAQGRLYFAQLRVLRFMNACFMYCVSQQKQITVRSTEKAVHPINRPIYNEFATDFKPIRMDPEIMEKFTTVLHFTSATARFGEVSDSKIFPINTHSFSKIGVIFVYGSDFGRAASSFEMFYFWNGRYFGILTALLFGALVLYGLRRRVDLQNVNFVGGFLEIFSLVFGGGNIQYRHRMEKWFFAIRLTASFFLVTIYLADFSMQSVLYRNSPKIDSFEKLAKRNVSFHLSSRLIEHQSAITEILSIKLEKPINMSISCTAMTIKTNTSYACVFDDPRLDEYKVMLNNYKKDFDVIDDDLGFSIQNFYLKSDLHVPQQIIDRFDHLTMSIMENGWFKFLNLMEKFWTQISRLSDDIGKRHQFEFEPITLDEFYYPLIVWLCHLAVVALVYIGEVIWYRIEHRWIKLKSSKKILDSSIQVRELSTHIREPSNQCQELPIRIQKPSNPAKFIIIRESIRVH